MSAPVAQATRFRPTTARNVAAAGGGRLVTHREYVAPIAADAFDFTLDHQLVLNPGNALLFPWLSTIALQYETYRFIKLRFVYTARTSTATPGSVIFTPDYDPSDPAPPNLRAALTASGSLESVPWKDLSISLPTSALHADMPRKHTRDVINNIPDSSKYDAGIFRAATAGFIAEVGHLWVEYTVSLQTPQLPQPATARAGIDSFNLSGDVKLNPGGLGAQSPTVVNQIPASLNPGETSAWEASEAKGHGPNSGNVQYDPVSDHFTMKKGKYRVRYSLDTIQAGTSQSVLSYSFLQPGFTTTPPGEVAELHVGPCLNGSGNLNGTKGRYQNVVFEEFVTLLADTVMQFTMFYIAGEIGGTGGALTESFVTSLSSIIFQAENI